MKKTMFFMVVFFFVGMVSINAQYVGQEEAVTILKGEITTLEADLENTPPGQEWLTTNAVIGYYSNVVNSIDQGSEVGAAIFDNAPQGIPTILSNDLVTAVGDGGGTNGKQTLQDMVSDLEELLEE